MSKRGRDEEEQADAPWQPELKAAKERFDYGN